MADFDAYLAQGEKLGLTGDMLAKFIEKQEQREERRLQRDHEKEQREYEKELANRAEKEKALAREHQEKMEKQADKQREYEKNQADKQREYEKDQADKQRAHELEMKRIELEGANRVKGEHDRDGVGFDKGPGLKSSYIPKLPPFDEKSDEIDSFLFRFEAHAKSCGWKEQNWPLYISSLLKGSALSLYHSLASKEDLQWQELKQELLKKFQCTGEGFRNKFRSIRPDENESFAAFLIRSSHYLDRWIELSNTSCDFEHLRDLLLREQILQSVSVDLATFLKEKDIQDAEQMCKLADQYKSAHPNKSVAKKTATQVFDTNVSFAQPGYQQNSGPNRFRGNYYNRGGDSFRPSYYQGPSRGQFSDRRSNGGNHYRFWGPSRGQYSDRGSNRGNQAGQHTSYRGQTYSRPFTPRGGYPGGGSYGRPSNFHCYNCGDFYHIARDCPFNTTKSTNVADACEDAHACPHCGSNVNHEKEEGTDVKQGLVSHKTRDGLLIEECMVNGYSASLLRDTGCTTAGVKRSLVSKEQYTGGMQRCRTFGGTIESFPLARITVHTPYFEGELEACVIDEPVADFILGNLPGVRTNHGGKGGSLVCEPVALVTTRAQSEALKKDPKPLPSQKIEGLDTLPEKFRELQKNDTSLTKCFEQVKEETALDTNAHCFILKNDILTRIYQTKSDILYQVVVPKPLRNTVLQVSHDIPMAGHFGVRRTLSRVFLYFYWLLLSAVSCFDVFIYLSNIVDLVIKLREVFTKLREFGLCVRPTKMYVGFRELDFLGHRLVDGHLKPQEVKVTKIVNTQTPHTKRQVRALLGLLSYYRRYVPDFAGITTPLTSLTKDSASRSVKWNDECAAALRRIQQVLLSEPILLLPNLDKEFTLRTDASANGMGGVLLQECDGLLHPVQYISKKFNDAQLRYSTIERECLAIVWAMTKLSRFLTGREFVLQTDHRPLTFLKASKTKNNRLLRWALMLQEFKFVVCPIQGRANTLADLLSRQ